MPTEQQIIDYIEQSFFFLRDIAPVHQHHDPSSDTIVRVHQSELDFKRRIYFDLFRSIIKYKRVKTPENIMAASGILAYAKSFKDICKDGSLPNDYQVDNLKMSLEFAQFKLDHKAQTNSNRIALVLTTAFAIFGAIVSISSLSSFASQKDKDRIIPSENLINWTAWMAEHPIPTGVASVVLAILILVIFGLVRPNRFAWFEDAQRLLQHLHRNTFLVIFLGIGSLVTFLGIVWFLNSL